MSKPKFIAPLKISSKELDKWNNKDKGNGREASKPSNKKLSQELLKMFQPPSLKAGKKSRRSVKIFMMPPLKSCMKWPLLKQNKKPDKPRRISNKVLKMLRKVPKMSREMLKVKLKKVHMRPKKLQECNLKSLSIKTSRKELLILGRMLRKELRSSITKLHKKSAKWSVLMQNLRPNRPNKILNPVPKRQSNRCKKPLEPKKPTHSKPKKNFKKQLEQTPKAKQNLPKNTSSKELKI